MFDDKSAISLIIPAKGEHTGGGGGSRMGKGGSSLICPQYKQETGIGTAGIFDHVFMSRKKCERCGKEFLIVNGVPMKPEDYQASGQA
jgi:hypothetical protein